MDGRGILGIIALVGVVAVIGAAGIFVGFGLGAEEIDGILGEDSKKSPALLSFESAGAQCTDDFMANSSTSVTAGGANTEISYARNVSLPGPSYAIGNATFERVNESAYALSVPIESTAKPPRECSGVARYEGTMRIPAGDDPWRLIVKHDDETVTTLDGDSNSSSLGGSARVGQSVSEPGRNSTETSAHRSLY